MSFKKVCYYFSIVLPVVNFFKTFVENVKRFQDSRQYLEELNKFNSTYMIDEAYEKVEKGKK